jgi:hypothetical protein
MPCSVTTNQICNVNITDTNRKYEKEYWGFRWLVQDASLYSIALYGYLNRGKSPYLVIPTGILFITTILIWCPLYEILGINTDKEKVLSDK